MTILVVHEMTFQTFHQAVTQFDMVGPVDNKKKLTMSLIWITKCDGRF